MKYLVLCLAALSLMTVANARQCGFKDPDTRIVCSISLKNDTDIHETIAIESCDSFPQCCAFDGVCYLDTLSANNKASGRDIAKEKRELLAKAKKVMKKVERNLNIWDNPFPTCPFIKKPFPSDCNPQGGEPYVIDPPANIPYCQRIPCSYDDNSANEKNHLLCGSQPGCYFDQELYELREAFGPAVLPGVPVCHLAIRNVDFQREALKVIDEYGEWNPYFTNCLLNHIDEKLQSGPEGCAFIPILEVFHIKPKLAGWKNIISSHCPLIGGCWRPGQGCFYPVDVSNIVVKSGQKHTYYNKREIAFGRPKCQHFDTRSAYSILKSYDQCLTSGCTVDSTVIVDYYSHLFSIGESMSVEDHWKYWEDVEKGLIGAHNIEEVKKRYHFESNPSKPTPPAPKKPLPFPLPNNPFDMPRRVRRSAGGRPRFSVPGFPPLTSGKSKACGFAFKNFGARPCGPLKFPHTREQFCPYKPLYIPRFRPLTGSFEGCCDTNLCYLSKDDISRMHSGPAYYHSIWSYWTECSATCGEGVKKRYRSCISQDPKKCTEHLEETVECQKSVCATWGQWSAYTPCPKSCYPGGIRSRYRECFPKGGYCPGEKEEVISCNEHSCDYSPPSGVWTDWQDEDCVFNRFKGMCEQSRTRYCTYRGVPGGKCVGSSIETKKWPCRGCQHHG